MTPRASTLTPGVPCPFVCVCPFPALPHSLSCAFAAARIPAFWTGVTRGDFLKGEVEDLSIDSDGASSSARRIGGP